MLLRKLRWPIAFMCLIFASPLQALTGDLNCDGRVDFTDFFILADHFGTQGEIGAECAALIGDLNCDSTVNFTDFFLLADNFNTEGEIGPECGAIGSAASIGQQGVDRPPITNTRIAVFVIDFPDTPQSIKDNYFPTIAALRDTILNGQIRAYFSDMSYGQFTITGDVFGYFTHQNPGLVNGAATELDSVVNISTINIPGFDISRYDGVIFVSVNDAGLAGGRAGYLSFQVNGISYAKRGMFIPIFIGYPNRDAKHYGLVNSMSDTLLYIIPTGTDAGIEGPSTVPFSSFDRVFSHELIHYLGIQVHATSRTNGTAYDYQPEVANNNCGCYSDEFSARGDLLDLDYGNNFDVMGHSFYGMSLNMVFRDFLGWTNASNRYSIKDYGHYSATISPLNSSAGIRTVEIRIPFQFNDFATLLGYKNRGYFLEVRTANNRWDNMLSHAQLQENNNGVMVLKTDGFYSQLLDMSPSANISYYGQVLPDIRDVVLKPGMTYENKELRLSNVRKNGDGSFTIDVDVLRP